MKFRFFITDHAKQRAQERMGVTIDDSADCKKYVKEIFCNEREINKNNPLEYAWFTVNIQENTLVRIKDDFAFLFKKIEDKITLITILPFNINKYSTVVEVLKEKAFTQEKRRVDLGHKKYSQRKIYHSYSRRKKPQIKIGEKILDF